MNAFFHGLHLAIILFLVLGWIFPSTRSGHFVFIVLTLGSWLALGYCPLTRWHWDLRQAAGLPRPQGPYIPFLAAQIRKGQVDVKILDRQVVILTVSIALLSLWLNAMEYLNP